MTNPALRQEGETPEEYRIFTKWLNMGPLRDNHEAAIRYYVQSHSFKWDDYLKIREANQWDARAAKWDADWVDPDVMRQTRNQARALKAQASMLGLGLCVEFLTRLTQQVAKAPEQTATVDELAKLSNLADKLSRSAFGEADSRIELTKPIQDLTDEELQEALAKV